MANYKGKKYTPNKSVVDRSKIGGFKDIVRSALGQGWLLVLVMRLKLLQDR